MVCPLGKLGDISYGGTASVSGGRARPTTCFAADVMASAPTAVMATSTSGVASRHR